MAIDVGAGAGCAVGFVLSVHHPDVQVSHLRLESVIPDFNLILYKPNFRVTQEIIDLYLQFCKICSYVLVCIFVIKNKPLRYISVLRKTIVPMNFSCLFHKSDSLCSLPRL